MLSLTPGLLWPLLQQRQWDALASGALQPIHTRQLSVEEGGVCFLIRRVSNLVRKQANSRRQGERAPADGKLLNPFLPPEPALFVADLSETHRALLNKFNVLDHHLLIVTRRFVPQETELDRTDFQALSLCMAECESLGFYNSGPVAGASQAHKHLQWAPLPLSASGPAVPIEPLLQKARWENGVGLIPGLPFRHAVALLEPAWATQPLIFAATMHDCYQTLLKASGIEVVSVDGERRPSEPYNLLMTRRWLLLIPRARECFEGISINALGFAGSLFVKNEEQLDMLRRRGPLTALQSVAWPRG